MKIVSQYIVHTQYGAQMLVETEAGQWYILTHHTLCYDGGGAASWDEITEEKAKELL